MLDPSRGSEATYSQFVDFRNHYHRRSPRKMSKLPVRDVVDLYPCRPVGSSCLLRLVVRSDQCNRRLDHGESGYSPSGMTSGSARGSGGLAAILVDFPKGMGSSRCLGDFPRPIFFKKRFMCALEGWGLRSNSGGPATPPALLFQHVQSAYLVEA